MIVSDLSAPVERVSLPEPRRSLAFVPSEGWESVLYAGTSGRVWRLDFGPVARLDSVRLVFCFPQAQLRR
jgi:hypothetical protein